MSTVSKTFERSDRSCCEMLLLAFALLLTTLTSAIPTAYAEEAKHGGTFRIGLEADLPGFDLLVAQTLGMSAATAMNVIEERLFDITADGKLIPVLGLTATPSEDKKSWTITLRKGVTFHDGTPFNADAVVHHWKRILNPENRFRGRYFLRAIKSVEKVDDHTVRFNLRHPWPSFLRMTSSVALIVAYIPSPKAIDDGTQNRAPVGTGPFIFKEWKSGDRFVAVKNPNYWQQGKPYLDEIVFRFLPDPQTRFASLKSGQVDLMWTDRATHIVKAIKDKSLVTYRTDDSGAMVLLLNNSKPPLDDPRVRRALAHAWNQALFVKARSRDTVPYVEHPFGTAVKCKDVGYRKFDLEKARKLLKEYGRPVELEIAHTTTPRGRDIAEIAQQFCKKIGVKVKPVPVDYLQLRKKIITNDFQLSGYYIRGKRDIAASLSTLFYSTSRFNLTRYNNPKMDELLLAQRNATSGEEKEAILCSIARLLNEDAPIIYGGGLRHYVFTRPEVKGLTSIAGGIPRVSEV